MTEHVDVPDGERHEPKGADSATLGQVYVSDGANSGAWSLLAAAYAALTDTAGYYTASDLEAALLEIKQKEVGGWAYYKDDGTSTQTITTSGVKLSINGLDASSDVTKLPLTIRGSDELWDVVSNDVTPIAVGDTYSIRLDVPITAHATSPTKLEVQMDIGSTASASDVVVAKVEPTDQTPSYTLSFDFNVHVTADFLANGAQFFLSTDVGTVTVDSPSILIVRTSNGSN